MMAALVLGTGCPAAMARKQFFGRDQIRLLIILPIWMLNEPVHPRQGPVTNVVAILVFVITMVPIPLA